MKKLSLEPRVCPLCGKEYEPGAHNRAYCPACINAARKRCGLPLVVEQHERKQREIVYQGATATIYVGKHAVVVDADVAKTLDSVTVKVSGHRGYYEVSVKSKSSDRREVLARMLMSPVPKGMLVDHINRNSLDNRRVNLRLATPRENAANIGKRRCNHVGSSKYKGVSRTKNGTWSAAINFAGKRFWIGTYSDEETAAMAYDMADLELNHEFAALNFPERLKIYRQRLQAKGKM